MRMILVFAVALGGCGTGDPVSPAGGQRQGSGFLPGDVPSVDAGAAGDSGAPILPVPADAAPKAVESFVDAAPAVPDTNPPPPAPDAAPKAPDLPACPASYDQQGAVSCAMFCNPAEVGHSVPYGCIVPDPPVTAPCIAHPWCSPVPKVFVPDCKACPAR